MTKSSTDPYADVTDICYMVARKEHRQFIDNHDCLSDLQRQKKFDHHSIKRLLNQANPAAVAMQIDKILRAGPYDLYVTVHPNKVLPLYLYAQGLYLEYYEYDLEPIMRNLKYLKNKDILKKVRLTEGLLLGGIRDGKLATLRLLKENGQRMIKDYGKVFNILSYHSASDVDFIRIDDMTPNSLLEEVMKSKVQIDDINKLSAIISTFQEIVNILKGHKMESGVLDAVKLRKLYQNRVALHPLWQKGDKELNFEIEGKDIFHQIEKGKDPDLITIGRDAYLHSNLYENWYPIAIIRSNSIQIIRRLDSLNKHEVSVLKDRKASEGSRKLQLYVEKMHLNVKEYVYAETYKEVGGLIRSGAVDLVPLLAPGNFLAEGKRGYKTQYTDHDLYTDSLLLVKKKIAREIPQVILHLLKYYKERFSEYRGSRDKPSRKFEHFIEVPIADELNNYCRDMLGVTRAEQKEIVNEHVERRRS